MRQAGTLASEQDARLFSDYLHSKGIANEAEQNRDGSWAIWIHDDGRLNEGREELERFAADPTAPVYRESAPKGRAWVAAKQNEDARFRERMVDVRTTWVGMSQAGIGWLTAILMACSLIVTAYIRLGESNALFRLLIIDAPEQVAGGYRWLGVLGQVRQGEIWRLITPIFIHGGFFHILFNMLWLKQLGTAIEQHEGTPRFGLQVLVYAVLSNLGQYFISGPFFGGMSGVVYGLFGYVWIRGKYDPRRPYELDQSTVTLMIIWFFLCFTGFVGPIANAAHTIGLVLGIIWASLAVRRIPFTHIRF